MKEINPELKKRFEALIRQRESVYSHIANTPQFDHDRVDLALDDLVLLLAAAYQMDRDAWISLETPPNEGIDILCTDNFTCYAVGWFANDHFFNDKVMNVTHWQPLPTPPQG